MADERVTRSPVDERVELGELFAALARKRWWIVATMLIATAALTALALTMTPVYRAAVILVPANTSRDADSLGSALGQLGGLATMAGLSIGSRGGNEIEEALAVLRSRQFTEAFVEAHGMKPKLFPDRWDAARSAWKPGREPTPATAYRRVNDRLRAVLQDKRTGLITLQIDWTDRQEAADWANDMAARLNDEMRARAIAESDASVSYLEKELARTTTVATRDAIGRLMEAQVKQRMIANVTREYSFRVIDRAMPPDADNPVRPNRLAMILGGILGGFALGVVIVLAVEWFRPVLRPAPQS